MFPHTISVKAIGHKEDSIYCDKCNLFVHIKCNKPSYIDFKYLSGNGADVTVSYSHMVT